MAAWLSEATVLGLLVPIVGTHSRFTMHSSVCMRLSLRAQQAAATLHVTRLASLRMQVDVCKLRPPSEGSRAAANACTDAHAGQRCTCWHSTCSGHRLT